MGIAGKISGNGALPKWLPLICIVLLAMGLVLGKTVRDLRTLQASPSFQYADGQIPMLTNFDGYFFMRLSQDLLSDSYEAQDPLRAYPRPLPAPLLSRVLSWLHQATGGSLRTLGVYLPPLLSCALIAAVLLWARMLGGGWCVAVSVLAAASGPYWLEVTAAGRLDKDCLNPVFLLLLAWCLARNQLARGAQRWLFLLGAAVVLLLFNWWWQKPGAALGLGFALIWALFGYARASWPERILKILLLVGTGSVLLYFLSQGQGAGMLWERYAQARDLLPLIFKTGSMAQVSGSIDELTGLSLHELALSSNGSWWALVAGVIGILWTAWTSREKFPALVFFMPLFLFGLLALGAQRFVLLFFPLAALGCGCFVERISALPLCRTKFFSRQGCCMALAALLLAPSLLSAWQQAPRPFLRQAEDRLALDLRDNAGKDAVIWNWWDYGYFLQYRTGCFTLLDGGMQTVRNCMLAAVPLACDDPVMAANWIRFFAAYGLDRFESVSADRGGEAQAVAWLQEVFSGKQPAPDACFPEVEVYVYLPVRFLRLSKYWLDFGTMYGASRPEKRIHLELFPAAGFSFGPQEVRLSKACRTRGYTSFPTVLKAGEDRLDGPALHSRPDPYLIHTPASPWVYAADFAVTQTLAFQLAVPTGFHHPCFEPVSYDPALGGVWRVRSCRPR